MLCLMGHPIPVEREVRFSQPLGISSVVSDIVFTKAEVGGNVYGKFKLL